MTDQDRPEARPVGRPTDCEQVEIYGLFDPVTDELRYIGKANDSAQRLRGHLRDSKRKDLPISRWIRKLSVSGSMPVVRVLSRVDASIWQETERKAIAEARSSGIRLLNVADGGEQPYCDRETRARNGRKNAATRDKKLWKLKHDMMCAVSRGYVSEATKEKLRAIAIRRPDIFACFAKI